MSADDTTAWKLCVKDSYVSSSLLLLLALIALEYVPILASQQRHTLTHHYADLAFPWFVIVSAAVKWLRAKSKGAKLFWGWIALAFVLDELNLLGSALLQDSASLDAHLLVGALGPFSGLCTLIAAAPDAHVEDDLSGQAYLRRNRIVGCLLWGFALLFYFLIIPAKLNPQGVAPQAADLSETLIDACVVIRLTPLAVRCSSRWRSVYGWMAAAYTCWFVGDIVFGLDVTKLWQATSGIWRDLRVYLPYVLMLVAIRSFKGASDNSGERVADRSPLRDATLLPSSIIFLFLLPAMHIALTSMVTSPPRVQFFRGMLVLVVSPILLLLVWKERRVLQEQRSHAEAQREQSERLFDSLFERAPDAYYMIDLQGRFVSGNRSAERMIGYSREELIGKHFATCGLVSSNYVCKALGSFAKNALGREMDDVELVLNRRDGGELPVEVRAFPVEFRGRTCILGIARDISDRKRIEAQTRGLNEVLQARLDERTFELREANARYRQVVDEVPAVTYVCELGCTGQWRYVSRQIESMFGYTPTEWKAEPSFWFEHVHPEDQNQVRIAEDACHNGSTYRLEYRLRTKKGDYRWVRDEARVFAEPQGELLMHGLLLDIHERKLLEEQLQQAHRLEAIGHLAGGIAHDFNNILNIIMGYSQLLLSQENSPGKLQKGLTRIFDATKRGASLTQQLLAFSRKQILQPQVIDLNDKLSEVQEMLSRVLGEDIDLVTRFHCATALIEADPNQIERVLINLAINARDAMPGGGRLLMETSGAAPEDMALLPESSRDSSQHVCLTVTDSGAGMDEETIRHIFEPFFTTKDRGRGTGLGLAQVYGIVQQSKGSISVRSTHGKGTEFQVFFPVVEGKPIAPEPRSIPVLRGTETILLVEDEGSLREVTAASLEEFGYRVLQADTPAMALNISRSYSGVIDLLVTDVIMPGMNGRQLAETLVASRPTLKVVFMSGYTDDKIARAGVLQPDVRLLQKPFTQGEVRLMVRQSLDEG